MDEQQPSSVKTMPHKIQEQFDIKTLEYYSYLKSIVQTNEMSYWIGNPSVSIINGSINLKPLILPTTHHETYNEYIQSLQKINLLPSIIDFSPKKQDQEFSNQPQRSNSQSQKFRSQYLVLCGIPNSKNPVEIIENNLLRQFRNALIQIRVIKTIQLKYYSMLLRFKNKKISTLFFNELFGKQYNQIEMEKIVLRQMTDITLCFSQIIKNGESNELKILRKLSQEGLIEKMPPQFIFLSTLHLKDRSILINIEDNNEKLVCTICLEEVNTQIISILCGHYFHCQCLQKWEFNTCPLCRYHQQPPVISFCEQCNQCEGLWVCLICGVRLCCGANNDILAEDSHIYQHYKESNHSLSMELQTKFIFDARVPAFLHQMFYKDLIQKGAGQEMSEQPRQKQDMKKNKLSDKIFMYQNQVAQQMHKQRAYFQQHMSKQVKLHREDIYQKKEKIKNIRSQLQSTNKQFLELSKQNQMVEMEIQKSQKEQKIINNLLKMLEDKIKKSKQKIQKINQMQHKRLRELQQLIEQKKSQLLNYKENFKIQNKFKDKLKGQSVQGEMVFMPNKAKGKKK